MTSSYLKTRWLLELRTPKKVKRVGVKIAKAAEQWLNANGYPGYLKDYKWEFNLVQDENVNAWCMPGGKIVFTLEYYLSATLKLVLLWLWDTRWHML